MQRPLYSLLALILATIDPDSLVDDSAPAAAIQFDHQLLVEASSDGTPRFPPGYLAELERRSLDRIEKSCARLGRSTAEVFNADAPATAHLYPTFESKALATKSPASFSFDDDGDLHLVLDERGISRPDGHAEAAWVLRRCFGEPSTELFDAGLPVALAGGDTLDEIRAIAAWIQAAGETTPFADLVDPKLFGQRSPLLQSALAAVIGELVLERHDAAALERAWRDGVLPESLDASHYEERLAQWAREKRGVIEKRRELRGAARQRWPERGVSFAHEGYRVYDGYLSEQAYRSLQRVRALGADAVSIMPFGSYRAADDPEVHFLSHRQRAGGETDESVLLSGARARALGMTAMLKPHLWGHGWCGEIEMQSEADWDRWFECYGEFLAHYALLGELGGFEWLCIGCELVKTTKDHADRWRALAERARRLFAGGITYAANWGEEVDALGFADALDAVGVDEYHPLSDLDAPTDQELLTGCRAVLSELERLSERFDRPLILTEIGYPARTMAWKDPHRSGRRDELSASDQARCYRALMHAWGERDRERVVGSFLWKWPTFEQWSGERTDYWPAGDEVEALLAALWR